MKSQRAGQVICFNLYHFKLILFNTFFTILMLILTEILYAPKRIFMFPSRQQTYLLYPTTNVAY